MDKSVQPKSCPHFSVLPGSGFSSSPPGFRGQSSSNIKKGRVSPQSQAADLAIGGQINLKSRAFIAGKVTHMRMILPPVRSAQQAKHQADRCSLWKLAEKVPVQPIQGYKRFRFKPFVRFSRKFLFPPGEPGKQCDEIGY